MPLLIFYYDLSHTRTISIISFHFIYARMTITVVIVATAAKGMNNIPRPNDENDDDSLLAASGIGSPIVVGARYLSITNTPGVLFLLFPSSPGQMNAPSSVRAGCLGSSACPSTSAILGNATLLTGVKG